ncbi:hydroxyphenylacetyl-CoA thioesterase PaaI [Ideonella livida]|uniref:Hydroxyphenylacetyl-CoA thioesterase PaaI n=1 Tax=Ideonella livida TaxID=2707176 RepID=A0A7C9TL26_9BURK|nr:hydroxyphenylacetyl-CoA thioesterase PaaI [Ideonella livida]NDY92184.1 hydroxyphenylacetyl-CoA thioesterase PaaI [Ideonella livida]
MSHYHPSIPTDPQALAEACRDAMWAGDRACQALGLRVLQVAPGRATVSMTVREDMVNGHAICHGGLIATLADSAFAYACNAYNEVTVASGFSIELLAPAQLGDELTASAREVSRGGRAGLYDIEVCNQQGRVVAQFRGRSHTFKGRSLLPQASG